MAPTKIAGVHTSTSSASTSCMLALKLQHKRHHCALRPMLRVNQAGLVYGGSLTIKTIALYTNHPYFILS
ncbi:MAG: hypothetical protein JKY48_09845 [Flavobacteriales bacterium]|nr:hypothetical protein [Flavobacteriales bacterium]